MEYCVWESEREFWKSPQGLGNVILCVCVCVNCTLNVLFAILISSGPGLCKGPWDNCIVLELNYIYIYIYISEWARLLNVFLFVGVCVCVCVCVCVFALRGSGSGLCKAPRDNFSCFWRYISKIKFLWRKSILAVHWFLRRLGAITSYNYRPCPWLVIHTVDIIMLEITFGFHQEMLTGWMK